MKSLISLYHLRTLKAGAHVSSLKVFAIATSLTLGSVSIKTEIASAAPKRQVIARSIENFKKTGDRWIMVDLSSQRLIAWEGNIPVYAVIVSTGKKKTPTRVGVFRVKTKLRKTRMRGRGYDVKNVPYTMYYKGGYAIHGAYWHNNFGTPMSHGCVNVAPNHAKWLFNWASVGTPVVVQR
ncbi:MAG: L,D-transpeptidase [Cyanobacteria bacterium P01_A01_bin.84]